MAAGVGSFKVDAARMQARIGAAAACVCEVTALLGCPTGQIWICLDAAIWLACNFLATQSPQAIEIGALGMFSVATLM